MSLRVLFLGFLLSAQIMRLGLVILTKILDFFRHKNLVELQFWWEIALQFLVLSPLLDVDLKFWETSWEDVIDHIIMDLLGVGPLFCFLILFFVFPSNWKSFPCKSWWLCGLVALWLSCVFGLGILVWIFLKITWKCSLGFRN